MKLKTLSTWIIGFILLATSVLAESYPAPTNSSGWTELYENGSIIQSAFTLYNAAWGGLFFTILFFVFQGMLYLKTRSAVLCFFTTGLTIAIVWLNPSLKFLISTRALWVFFVYLVILIASVIYQLKEGY